VVSQEALESSKQKIKLVCTHIDDNHSYNTYRIVVWQKNHQSFPLYLHIIMISYRCLAIHEFDTC
jgi:hypothetical protein